MPPIMEKVTKLSFCAHDTLEHHVKYVGDNQWGVFNSAGLLCTSAHLQNALGIMWSQTRIDSKDWTVLGE